MIAKFDRVSTRAFTELVRFIHSDENRVEVLQEKMEPKVGHAVRLMSAKGVKDGKDVHGAEGVCYDVVLEVAEEVGTTKLDSTHVAKIFDIIANKVRET